MPAYAYHCVSCLARWEDQLKISDRDKPVSEPCPECGEMKVEKTLTIPAITSGAPTHIGARVPDGFKDVLREIKKTSGRHCTIDV